MDDAGRCFTVLLLGAQLLHALGGMNGMDLINGWNFIPNDPASSCVPRVRLNHYDRCVMVCCLSLVVSIFN